MMVCDLESSIKTSPETPRFPSISYSGPIQTPQAHDVTEPPAISSQLPEVSSKYFSPLNFQGVNFLSDMVPRVGRLEGVYCIVQIHP